METAARKSKRLAEQRRRYAAKDPSKRRDRSTSISVSLPSAMLRAVDGYCTTFDTNRTGLIVRAVRSYPPLWDRVEPPSDPEPPVRSPHAPSDPVSEELVSRILTLQHACQKVLDVMDSHIAQLPAYDQIPYWQEASRICRKAIRETS